MKTYWKRSTSLVVVLAVAILVSVTSAGAVANTSAPKSGGTLTVLVVAGTWPGLDPLTDSTPTADATEFNAIYGQLFEQGPNGAVLPDLATGYQWIDNHMALKVSLRHGVKFTDGTSFNASAVQYNIDRDLTPSYACHCAANFSAVSSVTTSGTYTVILHLSRLFSPLPSAFINAIPGYIYSPTALQSEGEQQFSEKPVGAGPFEVQSDVANSTLTLVKNPGYWEKGHPYLSGLTFQSEGEDSSALLSMQSGEGQAITGLAQITSITQSKSTPGWQVIAPPSQEWEFVALNQSAAPFSNILAREAITYATNAKQITDVLYHGYYPITEGPSSAGQLFYEWKVPGYDSYNLAKAKKLVTQLGGLTVNLQTTSNTVYWSTEAEALASQWALAGIKTTIQVTSLLQLEVSLKDGNWQAADSNWGNYADPALALPNYFSSTGTFSGTHDGSLDGLMNKGAELISPTLRSKIYDQVYQRMATQADAVFLYQKKVFTVALKSVHGLPTNQPNNYWENVWLS
jgi:peptide/nickel transport system substrate-binding protein